MIKSDFFCDKKWILYLISWYNNNRQQQIYNGHQISWTKASKQIIEKYSIRWHLIKQKVHWTHRRAEKIELIQKTGLNNSREPDQTLPKIK